MRLQLMHRRAFAFVAALALLAFSAWASADPPSRVARLGYMAGAVSFSPAGEDDWVQASINRPLTSGDRLWTQSGARAEVQVSGAMVRMNAGTGISFLNLDDRVTQFQLTQGILNVRVRRLAPGQVFEVDTPNLAFTLGQPGEFRIEVDPERSTTTIIVRQGQGEVYGEGASYVIDSRQPYRFTGNDLRDYDPVGTPRLDEFDRWAGGRDRAYDDSGSARYVSPDVVGYQDLDAHGTWRVDATYGNVWTPNRVPAGWAPYRDGHWAWIDPWGWTWVDDAPWGFAVSHYGRWAHFDGRWGWVPGPVQTAAYYAPALVVFVGGANFQISISSGQVGGVGWFPLAPREVYRPSYPVSRGYFENVNRSNTVVNNTVINNYYDNTNVTNVVYANRQVPGAVVAVPKTTFVQSQPVSRAAVHVTPAVVAATPVAPMAQVAPTETSVRGAAAPGGKPPPRVFERPVVAHTAPAAPAAGFAAQQAQIEARQGQPLDDAARKGLKPSVAAPAPVVKVVAPAQAAPPTARPPAQAAPVVPQVKVPEAKAPEAKVPEAKAPARAPEQRGQPAARPQVQPPRVVQPQAAPSQAAPPVRPQPASAARQAERRPPEPVPKASAPRGQPASQPQARERDRKPAPGKSGDKKKDGEER